jgi:hypothetical protein
MSTSWDGFERELDAWGAAGRTATLWWRDDDATRPTPELDRLLDIAGEHGTPLALAVIPAPAVPELAQRLAGGTASVLQHGFAHRCHAGPGEKKTELGAQRPAATVLAELAEGRARLARLFAGTAVPVLPVLVPPWNRIAGSIVGGLPATGFTGLSTYNARTARLAAPGLLQVNTHADIVDWHGSRGFVGEAAALGLVAGHLAARRLGTADEDEPTGLITHHLVHDAACWAFCDRLAEAVATHPAARWLAAPDIFNMRPTGGMA